MTPLLATAAALAIAAHAARGGEHPIPRSRDGRTRVVAAARAHLGERFRGDCSSFVRRVYAEAKVPLPGPAPAASASEAMYRGLAHVRKPRAGDLAFFHRTYARDAPGHGRDLFTHVALVEAVHGSRVSLIHRAGAGVQRLAMNLARPGDPHENGAVRRRRAGDATATRYLAGELFAGYASPFPPRARTAPAPREPGPIATASRGAWAPNPPDR